MSLHARAIAKPSLAPSALASAKLAAAAAFAIPLLLLLLLRVPSLFEPQWNGDEGVFAAVATDMRHGDALYGGAWDNKPPLIFLTYAGLQSAFGTDVMPLHAAATLAALIAAAAVMVMAARLYGQARATVAGIACALLLGVPLFEANLASTEIFMIAPIALAMLAALFAQDRARADRLAVYALAGLLLGIAANFKQIALFDAAALGLVIWRAEPRPLRPLAVIAAGFVLPHAIFTVTFALTGSLGDYWYAVAGSLVDYAGTGDPGTLARIARLTPALLAAAYVLPLRGRAAIAALPVAWLGFASAGALSGPFSFPHYVIQAIPPFALLLAGLQWGWLDRESSLDRARALVPLAMVAVAVTSVLVVFGGVIRQRTQTHPYWYYDGYAMHARDTLTQQQFDYRFDGSTAAVSDIHAAIVADAAAADMPPGDSTLFAWTNMPWVYAATDLRNPTRYPTAWLGTWVPGAREEILADLVASPPEYLVLSEGAPLFPELAQFAAAHYTPLEAQNDWHLYRLR